MKFLISLVAVAFSAGLAHAQNSFVGQWKTIDDETNRAKSIIEIYEVDGKLHGKIQKVFFYAGEPQRTVCEKCTGDKKDKPLIGLEILSGLKKDSDMTASGGEIMDPKNGKTYSCKAELTDNGQKLKMRGFIGFSLLGRTQNWVRATAEDLAAPAPAGGPAAATSTGQTAAPHASSETQPTPKK